MIKLVYCVARKQGMSREEFYRTWLEDHGPLVKSHAKALRAVRYVQSHTGMDELNEGLKASRGLEDPYDGITEVWFEDLASMGGDGEAAAAAGRRLLEDEAEFIDLENSVVFMTEEHTIF